MRKPRTIDVVSCDRCQAEIENISGENVIIADPAEISVAHRLYNAVGEGTDLCSRCIKRLYALAEQIRTQPRRSKAWSEGPDSEKK